MLTNVAGIMAATLATIITSPADVIKVRLSLRHRKNLLTQNIIDQNAGQSG